MSDRMVVDEWREAHREIFLEVPEILKEISCSVDSEAVVVGRLKRMDTIIGKLRCPGLNMKLNEMCDIVGVALSQAMLRRCKRFP